MARYRHPQGQLVHECAVVAQRLARMLDTYPDAIGPSDALVLRGARETVLTLGARLNGVAS